MNEPVLKNEIEESLISPKIKKIGGWGVGGGAGVFVMVKIILMLQSDFRKEIKEDFKTYASQNEVSISRIRNLEDRVSKVENKSENFHVILEKIEEYIKDIREEMKYQRRKKPN